jgi:alpha-L-rhamnosidase
LKLDEVTWKAKWIWDAYNRYTANSYVCLKKHFHLSDIQNIEEISIYCTCSSEYKLFVNERYIGRGSVPSQLEFQYYDRYDFRNDDIAMIFSSENHISAVGYNYGVGLHYRPASPAGFLFQMEVKYSDGPIESIISDGTWDICVPAWWRQNTQQMYWTIGFQELIDLNKLSSSFFTENSFKTHETDEKSYSESTDPSSFVEETWSNAVEIGIPPVKPWLNLIPRDIPHLVEEILYPEKVTDLGECEVSFNTCNNLNIADIITGELHKPLKEGIIRTHLDVPQNIEVVCSSSENSIYIVYDFGKEVVGYPVLEFVASSKAIFDVGYSECLDGRGRVDPTRQDIRQADRIIVTPGSYKWEIFGRRAFRYLQITVRGADKPINLNKVYIKALRYPFGRQGNFYCNDDSLNRIFEVSKYTLDVCMKENYEDCPLREHAQYIGDMRVEALMNYYAFGDMKLIAKGLRQFAREQNEDGWFKTLCPGSTNHNIVDYLPLWVICLWDYYLFSGDKKLIEELYVNVGKLMNWLESQAHDNGLIERKNDWWIFIDWADIKRNGIVTGLQCFYYKSLIDAAKIAEALGHKEDKKYYLQQAEKLRLSINEFLWDEKEGVYIDCLVIGGENTKDFSIQTNHIAVITNVANESQRNSIKNFIKTGNYTKVKTGYFKLYELESLHKLKLKEEFISCFKYWGNMLKRGAATWWEIFDDTTDMDDIPNASLCHAWSAAPLYHLHSKHLGVTPLEPGFNRVLIKPDLYDLTWIEGSIPSVKGDIKIRFEKCDELLNLSCVIPKNVVADILIPVDSVNCKIVLKLNGAKKAARIIDDKLIYYKINKPGEYEFTVFIEGNLKSAAKIPVEGRNLYL